MNLQSLILLGLWKCLQGLHIPEPNSVIGIQRNRVSFSDHKLSNSKHNMSQSDKYYHTKTDPFSCLQHQFPSEITPSTIKKSTKVVQSFITSVNERKDPIEHIKYFSEDVRFVNDSFFNPISGYDDLLKHFYLHSTSSFHSSLLDCISNKVAVDDLTVCLSDDDEKDSVKIFILYHVEDLGGVQIDDSRGITYFYLDRGKITNLFNVVEPPSPKPSDTGLKLLKFVSKWIENNASYEILLDETKKGVISRVEVKNYFSAWNERNMTKALESFTDECVLEDTQYSRAFNGKKELAAHLANVNDCLPKSFDFKLDEVVVMSTSAQSGFRERVGALWHVENNGAELSFTRGCSFYKTDGMTGLIQSGIEIPEKAPPKFGLLNTIKFMFQEEPIRFIPAILWVAYMGIVFLWNILPGANALQFEMRTWVEVRDLSINFFLVSPTLGLPFSPTLHPMLEGVFNLLLSWAAMFAGFLSDDRKNKPNLLSFWSVVVGMQFLTSAFLLPYLALRSQEKINDSTTVYMEDISGSLQTTVSEWRPLGALLGGVGTYSILWGIMGRPEFGDLNQRYNTFLDLLSIDRVGSSFLVDLVIFALFQGWFIDDDMKRRGVNDNELIVLRNIAKFIPFYGLVAYLTFRPGFPSNSS